MVFRKILGDEWMKAKAALIVLGLIAMLGGASRAEAQVKRVQMHIAGYLCGN
jgi:energy-converting hydrogenase Eha subunit E